MRPVILALFASALLRSTPAPAQARLDLAVEAGQAWSGSLLTFDLDDGTVATLGLEPTIRAGVRAGMPVGGWRAELLLARRGGSLESRIEGETTIRLEGIDYSAWTLAPTFAWPLVQFGRGGTLHLRAGAALEWWSVSGADDRLVVGGTAGLALAAPLGAATALVAWADGTLGPAVLDDSLSELDGERESGRHLAVGLGLRWCPGGCGP